VSSRTYTIRGKHPSGASHTKLQLASYDPTVQYQIIEFKIMPAGGRQCDLNGILTLNRQDSIDPTTPNFERQTELAWARYTVHQGVPPGIGESFDLSHSEIVDDRWFNYNIWIHTEDALAAEEINYFVRILKIDTSETAGAISSLRQYSATRLT